MTYAEDNINRAFDRLKQEAEDSGYYLNPDTGFTKDLVKGLLVNRERYRYLACPCRLASGNKAEDLDIICPCDYRDKDLAENGSCYCGLYVSQDVVKGEKRIRPIHDRRPIGRQRKVRTEKNIDVLTLPLPIWRCRVCGYLCARDNPPEICPICKAVKERFERFCD
jgi:ferredoxin-thioredoxin reductase catalytic subunit